MNTSKRSLIKKGDVGILLSVLFFVGIFAIYIGVRSEGEYVYITIKGETEVYPLGQDIVISLEDGTDTYNTIVIENHTVFMENASCPDQICVHHKAVSKNGETIICLPNQVFIEIESDRQREVDN